MSNKQLGYSLSMTVTNCKLIKYLICLTKITNYTNKLCIIILLHLIFNDLKKFIM